ncbi:MAG: LytR C-terminal domain-containing protein [bacterium]|nr:LytR C-terminal domain-containing protein [bacterium]
MAKRSMDIEHPKYDPDLKPDESAEPPKESEPVRSQKPVPKQMNDMTPETMSEKRDVFWPVYLVGIVIVAILAFFGVRAGAKLVDTWMDLKPSSVDTGAATPATETDAATPAPTDAATTPVAVAEPTPAPAPAKAAIDKAALKIRVLNGGGVSGAGDAAKKVIEAAGFKVDSVGNAKKFSYETSFVYYPKDKKAEADLLSESLKDKYSITTEENEVAAGYDALVVIGKK